MVRRCKGLCKSFGIFFQTPGRGEPTRTQHRKGRRMGRRCKGFCRPSGLSVETPGRGEPTRTKHHRGEEDGAAVHWVLQIIRSLFKGPWAM